MKKLFLAMVAVFAMSMTVNAQDRALGVRCGGGQGYGAEISYMQGLGGNRLEVDLGFSSNDNISAYSLTGIYQWTGSIGSGFGWYAGVGANLGYWSGDNGGIALAVAGQAGIEYRFTAVPLQLSLDIRPRFNLLPSTNLHWGDIALGIRYCF